MIKFLSNRGHQVWLACFDEENEIEEADLNEIKSYCQEMVVVPIESKSALRKARNLLFSFKPAFVSYFQSSIMKRQLERLIRETEIHLIHVEFVYLSEYIRDIDSDKHARLLVDEELNFRAMRRIFRSAPFSRKGIRSLLESLRFKRYELNAVKLFDKTLMITEEEKRLISDGRNYLDVEVYPNTVDTEFFAPLKIDEESLRLSFVGNFRHYPNVDGITWFANKIYPHILERYPDCQLMIIGANVPDAVMRLDNGREITVIGYIDDIRPHLARSTVVVCPIISGGGMRGKVLEAMSLRKAVVSTSIGVEGINVAHGRHLLIADSEEEFAIAVGELLTNKLLRESIGHEARKLATQSYDDEVVFSKLEATYQELAEQRGRYR